MLISPKNLNSEGQMIGILGGMGPLATVDLFNKIITETGAAIDQKNIPIVIYSDPTIPDRRASIMRPGNCVSPFSKMRRGAKYLDYAGVSLIVIACNTAHHWFDALQSEVSPPILHIADAVCSEIETRHHRVRSAALIATEATTQSGFYQKRLSNIGVKTITMSECEINDLFEPIVSLVKGGNVNGSLSLALRLIKSVQARNPDILILACTELPIVFNLLETEIPHLDSTAALARATVDWWRAAISDHTS